VTTIDHIAFTCTERPEIESRLKRYGIPFESFHTPEASRFQIFFKDPAGNGVELNFTEK
jgi:glyoxylase I family protein